MVSIVASTFSFPLHDLGTPSLGALALSAPSQLGAPSQNEWSEGTSLPASGAPTNGEEGSHSASRLNHFIADCENPLIRHWYHDTFLQSPLSEQVIWPLCLYGPSGIGKTSLAETLAFRFVQQGWRAAKWTATDFRRLFLHAISIKTLPSFRERFRQFDIVILDDLKGFGRDFACQREWLQLWDHLHFSSSDEHRIRWIVTSTLPPWSCDFLCPELRSRLTEGLSIGIKPPGPDARREIAAQLCQKYELSLEPAAFDWLVDQLPSVPALMQREFSQLAIHFANRAPEANRSSEPISLANLRKLKNKESLATHFPKEAQQVIRLTARSFGLPPTSLKNASRKQAIVRARSVAIYLLRNRYTWSFSKIGRYFGNRDASTIRHAFHSIQTSLMSDPQLAQQVDQIQRQLELRTQEIPSTDPAIPTKENLSIYR